MTETPSKLEHIQPPGSENADDLMKLIVKVTQGGYIPTSFTVHAQISPEMFTCVAPRYMLPLLEQNDKGQFLRKSVL